MTRIKILPETLSNKIAAGEVIERPSSVVKELVENALDAGSSKITVEIERGGRSLVRVSDNGTGMGHDDALLSLERYGTSKLTDDTGLFSIRTLGFRGEALPSIASVSKMSLITRAKEDTAGTAIEIEGGKIKSVSEIGAPPGTMISVKQLFYNTPARRKFLKTINTEMGHIAEAVSRMALSRPDIHFRLIHNGKIAKSWPAADPRERVADVLGKDLFDVLHPVNVTSDAVSISGWIASPRITRTTARSIYLFVNGRYVYDRMVHHGLFEGYRGRVMKGQYPVAALHIDVPPDRVDVNVHPTKKEVRFLDQEIIHRSLIAMVSKALEGIDRTPWPSPADAGPARGKPPKAAESVAAFAPEPRPQSLRNATTIATESFGRGPDAAVSQAAQDRLWEEGSFAELHIIGQLHNTYILCEAADGLILVDQHAAHERVLIEQLQLQAPKTASQSLLVPETLDVGYREADALNSLIPELHRFGLEIESFGGNAFTIRAIPAFLTDRDIKPLIAEILEEAVDIDTGSSTGLEKAMDRCLNIIACHGAIRAHQRLDDQQMKELLRQLDGCRHPSQCPHGRPTWIHWSTGYLEKSFKRIV